MVQLHFQTYPFHMLASPKIQLEFHLFIYLFGDQ
jgi:hypothetical protein